MQNLIKSMKIKRKKEKALNSKNVNEIYDYISFLLNYVDNGEIMLHSSYYKECIKIIALRDEETIINFLNNYLFSSKNNSQERKEIIWALINNIEKYNADITISKLEDIEIETGNAKNIYMFAKNVKGANIPKLENSIIETGNAKNIYMFAKNVKGANIPKLTDAIIETGNAKKIYMFAKNVKEANILKLADAIIETENVKYIYLFAKNIIKFIYLITITSEGEKLYNMILKLFNLKEFDFAFDLLWNKISDEDSILEEYIKKFIFAGEISYSKKLLSKYEPQYEKVKYQKLTPYEINNMKLKRLIEMGLIDKNDIDDYLIKITVERQINFKNILKLDNVRSDLLKKKAFGFNYNQNDLIYENCLHGTYSPLTISDYYSLELINLSLIYYNVLPSVVKDFEEVKNNVELYLDLLKKCDEKKYYYYKNAFEGKISFEQADSYYKYYIDNLIDNKIDLWDDMEKILKLKYPKNKKQIN